MNFSQSGQELTQYLNIGEELVWSSTPRRGWILRGCEWFLMPLSLIWGVSGMFGAWIYFHQAKPGAIFGILFIVFSLYMLVGRFIYDAERRKRTVYGITKDRILIKSGLSRPSLQSISIAGLLTVELILSGNGKGNIVLAYDMQHSDVFRSMALPGSGKRIAPALEGLPDAVEVYKLIQRLRKME